MWAYVFGIDISNLNERLDKLDTQMDSMVDSLDRVVELLEEVSHKLTATFVSGTIKEQGPLE